jgi:LacI family transcriptional regulator
VPRLQDVALRAGVTKSIASRILNAAPVLVRPETRARVEAAARDLGYRPNPAARALNRSSTGSVAFVVPDLANVVYSRIVRGAVRAATASDLSVLVMEDTPGGGDVAALVASGRIDGVIMLAARPGHPLLPLLLAGGTPCVFAHRGVAGSGRNVTIDDAHASELAVAHLHGLGHRRIGHVAGQRGIDTAERRVAGFRASAKRLGLTAAPVLRAEYGEQHGADAARRMLARDPEITAIFTASLPQAIGVRAAAAELGLDVPRQLSIVSYDDMPFVEFLQPALTTVRVPLEELGETALHALHDQLAGNPAREHVIATAPQIVVRQSTAEAP